MDYIKLGLNVKLGLGILLVLQMNMDYMTNLNMDCNNLELGVLA